MSRTNKDRPDWVKRNDPKLLRYTNHNHLNLGKTYYKTVYVRDSDNNYVTEEVTRTTLVFREGAAKRAGFLNESTLINTMNMYGKEYEELWREEEYISVEHVTKRVPRTKYVDHCTEGELLKGGRNFNLETLPCQPELVLDWKRGQVSKTDRQIYHGQERRRELDILKRYAREATTHGWEDLQDDDTPDTQRRTALWW